MSSEERDNNQLQVTEKPMTALAGCVVVYIVISVQNIACIFLLLTPHLGFKDANIWGKNFTIICSFLTLLSCVIKRLIYYETIPLFKNFNN